MMSGQNSEGASPWVGGGLIRGVSIAGLIHGPALGRNWLQAREHPLPASGVSLHCKHLVLLFLLHALGLTVVPVF